MAFWSVIIAEKKVLQSCINRLFSGRGLAFISQFMFAATGEYQLDSVIENALEWYKSMLLFDNHKDNASRPRDAIDFKTPAHIQSSPLFLGRFDCAYYHDEKLRDMRGRYNSGVNAEDTLDVHNLSTPRPQNIKELTMLKPKRSSILCFTFT